MNTGRTGQFFLWLTLLIFLTVSGAGGVVYKWEDENGNVFFADDLKKVPEQYRSQTEERSSSERGERDSLRSRPSILFEQKTDLEGKGKNWWRDLVKRWEEKKRDADNRIEALELEMRQLTFHKGVPAKSMAKEKLRMTKLIKAAQLRRDVAIRMLTEGLPDEARKAGAPLEWLSDKP